MGAFLKVPKVLFGGIIFTLFISSQTLIAQAAINEQIAFYGTLQDTAGTNLAGTYDMVFRFYDAPSGGTLLDVSTHTVANGNPVTVSAGEFRVQLGSGTGNALNGLNFNTNNIYIGLTIGSDSEMTPRERLSAAPYAFNADRLDGYDSLDLLRLNTSNTISASTGTALLSIVQNGVGDVLNIFDGGSEVFSILDGGNVGVGTSSPVSKFTVAGDIRITGAFRDSSGDAGTSGMVLLSTVTGTNWVATSSLGISGGGGSSLFTDGGATTYLTATGDNLAIGGIGGSARLNVYGDIDIVSNNAGLSLAGTRFFYASTTNFSLALGDQAGETFDSDLFGVVAIGYRAGRYASTSDVFESNFIGTEAGLNSIEGQSNIIGAYAGWNATGGENNIFGYSAGYSNRGYINNIFGKEAGYNNTGDNNSIIGYQSGFDNTGQQNNLLGTYSGYQNSGFANNILGYSAGYNNIGDYNNLFGIAAGYNNTGNSNNIFGDNAGFSNSGNNIVAIGLSAAENNVNSDGIFIGRLAGQNNKGLFNYFIGTSAGRFSTGSHTIAIGLSAGYSSGGSENVYLGLNAGGNSTSSRNAFVGYNTGYANTGERNSFFGVQSGESNTGDYNNFFGYHTGNSNSGNYNNIIGVSSGIGTTGNYNNYLGYGVSDVNQGNYNNFFGYYAARYLSATNTIAIGTEALYGDGVSGTQNVNNIAIGYRAGYGVRNTSDNNILIGYRVADNLTTGNNNIIIGYDIDNVTATADNRLNIGNLLFGTGLDGTGTTLSSGNIGIGTTTPNQKLSVFGTDTQIQLLESGSEFLRVGVSETNNIMGIGWANGDSLTFGVYDNPTDTSITRAFRILGTGDGYISNGKLFADSGNAGSPAFSFQNDIDSGFYSPGDGAIRFSSNNSNVFSIINGGNVGIGTTTPASRLVVAGDLRVTGALRDTSGDAGTNGQVLVSTLTGTNWVATSSLGISGGGGSSLFTDGGATTYLTATGDNLSIGGTSSSEKLSVSGNINLTGNYGYSINGTRLFYASTTTGTVQIGQLAGAAFDGIDVYNVAIGYLAAGSTTPGYVSDAVIIGREAGYNSEEYGSVLVGYQTAYEGVGFNNNIIGYSAAYNNGGNYNNILGYEAGYNNLNNYNNFFGYRAGYNAVESNTVLIGFNAGYAAAGDSNVSIGYSAGYSSNGYNNNFIGNRAGEGNVGSENVGIGDDAARFMQGTYNIALGTGSGYGNLGDYNLMLGSGAGDGNEGDENVFLGRSSGVSNLGDFNNFIGSEVGYVNWGNFNEFIGYQTGRYIRSTSSVAIGAGALRGTANFNAINNVALGYRAGYVAQSAADNNILIGYQAADNLTTGNNNIIIGYNIDNVTATADNRLNIGNLIFGTGIDGAGTTLSSGNIGIGTTTPAQKLQVFGNIRVGTSGSNGCIENFGGGVIGGTCSSDERLKTNITELASADRNYLERIVALKPVSYTWNDLAKNLYKKNGEIENIGLIAQSVEEQFPELVSKNTEGYRQVDFGALPFYIIEAVKELYGKVTGLEEKVKEIDELKERIERLEAETGTQYIPSPKPEPEQTQIPPEDTVLTEDPTHTPVEDIETEVPTEPEVIQSESVI